MIICTPPTNLSFNRFRYKKTLEYGTEVAVEGAELLYKMGKDYVEYGCNGSGGGYRMQNQVGQITDLQMVYIIKSRSLIA